MRGKTTNSRRFFSFILFPFLYIFLSFPFHTGSLKFYGVQSCLSDLKVWDAKTTENLHSFHPALSIGSHTEASVHTVYPLPGSTEQVLVSNRTSTAFLCTLQGQVVRSFTSPKVRAEGKEGRGGDVFVACIVSNRPFSPGHV